MSFEAGQRWAYAAPPEIADSRIVIGALVDFESGQQIACCAVTGAWQRATDGTVERVDIPFLPLAAEALARTVTARDGEGSLPDGFLAHLEAWQADERGLSYFTVPFEGSLDRLIALQMAALAEQA